MAEIFILSFQYQLSLELFNKRKPYFVVGAHLLQGALHMPLKLADDLIRFVAAVNMCITWGTNMNNTSSFYHCIASLKLTLISAPPNGLLTTSHFHVFELMGL